MFWFVPLFSVFWHHETLNTCRCINFPIFCEMGRVWFFPWKTSRWNLCLQHIAATTKGVTNVWSQWRTISGLKTIPPHEFTLVAAGTTTCFPCGSSPWKLSHPETYASGNSHHHLCPVWLLLREKLFPVRTFTVVYVHDTRSVSDSKVLCSCFMQHYLYNTQHFVSRVQKLWRLLTLHVSLIPRTCQFRKLNE